jgi:PQQ-like domain
VVPTATSRNTILQGTKRYFTKPDGTTYVVSGINTYQGDATAWFEYPVDQIGTWKIKFDFPGGYYPAGNYSVTAAYLYGNVINFTKSCYYKPSSDGPYEFVVQDAMVRSWPQSALPTDYWTRPVSPENREWWSILGNYPATGVVGGDSNWPADTNKYMSNYWFIPYVQGPKSAHIAWKRQGAMGGLIGGTMEQLSYSSGGGGPSIVYAGRAYETISEILDGQITSVWRCYDIRTGEVFWERTNFNQAPTMITYVERTVAMVPGEEAGRSGMNVHLVYVGGGRYIRYDPWLGSVNLNVSIAPMTTGTLYASDCFLSVQNIGTSANPNYRLINWTIIGDIGFPSGTNWRMGVINNITWPFSSVGTADFEAGIAVTTASIVTPGAGGDPLGILQVPYGQRIMAASLTTGQLLWNVTTDASKGTQGFFSGSTAVADHGKWAVRLNDGHWHSWDLFTGREVWKSELSSWPWGTFGCYGVQSYGGNIISNQYDGVVAYNWSTGKISWWYDYKAEYPYETPYQDNYPWFTGTARIADGVLYTYNTEHSPSQPIQRGLKLHAINANTGEGIWNITGCMAPGAVADGYLTASNSYDGYMYVFGKGKSATTVTAPDVSVPLGTSFTIKGTVMDLSPAQPNTPCVSKDSMATQMEYLHMQHPIDGLDHNVMMTGVPVTLTAIDTSGEVTPIGTTTTNAYYGTFGYEWLPPKQGKYTITATFAGDYSYGSSGAATDVSVGPAPAEITIPEQIVPPDYTMTIVGAAIAVIVAVALATVLILKKK